MPTPLRVASTFQMIPNNVETKVSVSIFIYKTNESNQCDGTPAFFNMNVLLLTFKFSKANFWRLQNVAQASLAIKPASPSNCQVKTFGLTLARNRILQYCPLNRYHFITSIVSQEVIRLGIQKDAFLTFQTCLANGLHGNVNLVSTNF